MLVSQPKGDEEVVLVAELDLTASAEGEQDGGLKSVFIG